MAETNLSKSVNIDTTAREVDFVTRFQSNWRALLDIMGVTRMIRKTPGTELKSKYAAVTLQSGAVGEGEKIPYSLAEVKTKAYDTINVEKYAKAVSIEAINEHGYEDAVGKTDDEFLNELQGTVLTKFYAFLATGTLISAKSSFQSAIAEARGRVLNKFRKMHKTVTEVVGFVNIMDAYDYLGAANIVEQNTYGMTYLKNFMGFSTLFLCSDAEVGRGKVYAVPVDNLINYFVSPDDSDFAKAGLSFTTAGDTSFIGFHTQGDYRTAVSECFAFMGMVLMAEYLDGIAAVDIGTAAFTEVSSPAKANIGTYFELDSATGDYFKTTDTDVVTGKTYYTRAVTPAA